MIHIRHTSISLLVALVATMGRGVPTLGDSATDGGPRVAWPAARGGERVFANDVAIVEPEFRTPNAQPDATFVTYADGHLQAWSPTSLKTRWQKPVECPYQPRNLLFSEDYLVFATNYEIFTVERSGGAVTWRVAVTPGRHDADDLVDADRWMRFGATNDAVITANSRSELVCINAESGARRWLVHLKGPAPKHIVVNGDAVYCVSTSTDATTMTVYDVRDGAVRSTIDLSATTGPGPLITTPFGLALCSASSIDAYDGDQRVWQFPLDTPIVRRSFAARDGCAAWLDAAGWLTALDLKTGTARCQLASKVVADAEWLVISPGAHHIVSGRPGMLVGIDADTGRVAWQHSGRSLAFAQPPIVVGDDLVIVQHLKDDNDTSAALPTGERLLIRRIDIASGMAKVVGTSGDIVTDRIARFGGLFVRDDAMILLDGRRLIDYVPFDRKR